MHEMLWEAHKHHHYINSLHFALGSLTLTLVNYIQFRLGQNSAARAIEFLRCDNLPHVLWTSSVIATSTFV